MAATHKTHSYELPPSLSCETRFPSQKAVLKQHSEQSPQNHLRFQDFARLIHKGRQSIACDTSTGDIVDQRAGAMMDTRKCADEFEIYVIIDSVFVEHETEY